MNPHLIRLGEIAWPPDLEVLYGRKGPFIIEVGFGNGEFLEEMYGLHPDWNLLGVEIAPASITRGHRRARVGKLNHVKVMLGQGAFAVREIAPPRGLHRVFVNFPDPWPKDKDIDRRLLRQPFLRMLSTRFEEGGALLLTTDHEEYFEYSVKEAEATGLYDVQIQDPPEEMLRTKYAQRWLEMRMQIHHVVMTKKAEDDEPHPQTVKELEVQHIRLKGDLDQIGDFEKSMYIFREGKVILRNCYRGFHEPVLIFLCIVQENDLRQQVMIEVRPSPGGIYVALMGFGAPVVTHGVKESVRAVAKWLQGHGMELVDVAL